jgi:hypothetical protein
MQAKRWLFLAPLAMAAAMCAAVEEVPYTEGSRPPASGPGECWCLVTIPAQYKTVTEQCQVSPPSCTWEEVPAVMETRKKRVCVKPETKVKVEIPAEYKTETYTKCVKKETCRKEKVPAVYEDREERVKVCGPKTRKIKVPATFKTVEEQVCVSPASSEWKKVNCTEANVVKGQGETKDECWCLVAIPARYETRTREVCVDKEKEICEEIPAEYKTVIKKCKVKDECSTEIKEPAVFETAERRVQCKPASCRTEVCPAEYKEIEETVCAKPASKRRIDVPAKFESKTREVMVCAARRVWRKTNCEEAKSGAVAPAPVAPAPVK